jgi:hypothetical protein
MGDIPTFKTYPQPSLFQASGAPSALLSQARLPLHPKISKCRFGRVDPVSFLDPECLQ